MADNKKYYYLKLKDNFFESEELVLLQSLPEGYIYSDILMKLYLKSLKNEGRLMFKDHIPYNLDMLAIVVRHPAALVKEALRHFRDLGLVDVLDNGAIFMLEIQNFIGKGSSEADRKRQYRKKIEEEKQLLLGQMSSECPNGTNVQQMSQQRPPEIEIELDIDLESNSIDAIAHFYQQNFGVLNPLIAEKLQYWIKDLGNDLVYEALARTALNGVRNFSYAESIMKDWYDKNIKTLDQVKALDLEHQAKKYEALARTALNGVRNFSYAESIMKDWYDKNIKTLDQVKALDLEHQAKKSQRNRKGATPIRQEIVPDWLQKQTQETQSNSSNEDAEERIKRANTLLADVGIMPLR